MHPDRWFNILRMRLRSLVRGRRVEDDLERELRSFVDRQTEENIASGMPPEEARRDALRRFGGVAQIQEECRDMRRTATLENLARDFQYAARTLAKAPGFTLALVLTLALSIGANTAIFSAIEGVLLRPLPYAGASRIVRVFVRSKDYPRFPLNPLDLRYIRARNRSFAAVAGITRHDRQLSGGGQPERLTGFAVTAGYFTVLGVMPELGREFTTADELPARGAEAILSDRVWRTRFAADRGIIDRRIVLDSEPFTVVGVMPPVAHPGNEYHAVADGDTVDVWTPFPYPADARDRGSHFMEAYARLKPGVDLAQAQADMDAQFAQLAREHPAAVGWNATVVSLFQDLVTPSRRMLLVLLGAAGLVLLIACANTANLLLSRATARRRELAVRAALGAARSRLVQQMLAESLTIAALGGVLGTAIGMAGIRILAALLPPGFPRAAAIGIDGTVFAFAFAATIGTGLLFGLAPALQAAGIGIQSALRESGRSMTAGLHQTRLRGMLVIGEIGLACLLSIGAGLLLRSFVNMLHADPGFRAEQVLTAAISLPRKTYAPKAEIAFDDRLAGDLAAIPGVRAAALGSDLPWDGYDENVGGFTVEGRPPAPGQSYHARYHSATEDYFTALSIPLLRGRFFTPHDDIKSRPVVIVNVSAARQFWGTEDAVGGRLTFTDQPKPEDWFTVAGVVSDVKDRPNSASATPAIWFPILQTPFDAGQVSVVVRARGDAAQLAAAVRNVVHSRDPQLAVANVRLMSDRATESFATPRFALLIVALFALLAATLSAMGVYGVISYSVSQRRQEFGLRMALGARPRDVLMQVMAHGVRLAAAGVLLGVAGALLLGRVLVTLLYEVKSSDLMTFVLVPVLVVAIAAAACYIPARRATSADPVSALRSE